MIVKTELGDWVVHIRSLYQQGSKHPVYDNLQNQEKLAELQSKPWYPSIWGKDSSEASVYVPFVYFPGTSVSA